MLNGKTLRDAWHLYFNSWWGDIRKRNIKKTQTFRVYDPSSMCEKPLYSNTLYHTQRFFSHWKKSHKPETFVFFLKHLTLFDISVPNITTHQLLKSCTRGTKFLLHKPSRTTASPPPPPTGSLVVHCRAVGPDSRKLKRAVSRILSKF